MNSTSRNLNNDYDTSDCPFSLNDLTKKCLHCIKCDCRIDAFNEQDHRGHSIKKLSDDELKKINEKESTEKIKNEYAFNIYKKNNVLEQIMLLDHPLRILRSQTIRDDDSVFVLVYLPTKTTKSKDLGDKNIVTDETFANTAFFVVNNKKSGDGETKYFLPYNHPELVSDFKIRVLPEWYESRWELDDLKLWLKETESTDPKLLYDLILETSKRYIEFPDDSDYIKFVLWNIGTYCYQIFDAYPYNDFTGTKQAGKSKALEFQKLVCFNAIKSPDMSSSSMFRVIEGLGSTVLLDETEQFKNQKNEGAQHLRTLIMQGYVRDQYAIRAVSKESDFIPTPFDIYGPKSLAHINAFDDTLEDRCIAQLMRRALDTKIMNSHPTERDPSFGRIRNLCYRLFLDFAQEIRNHQEEARTWLNVHGRSQQLWQPIVTLALFFEKHGAKGLVSAIEFEISESSQNKKLQEEEENLEVKVLRYLDDACTKVLHEADTWIAASELYSNLIADENRWALNSEWFKQRRFGEILARLGFKKRRIDKGVQYQVTKEVVDDNKKRLDMVDEIGESKKSVTNGLDTYADSSDPTLPTQGTLPDMKLVSVGSKPILHDPTSLHDKSVPIGVGSVGNVGSFAENRCVEIHNSVPENVGMSDSVGSENNQSYTNIHPYTDKKEQQFRCITCDAGPFGINEKTRMGLILNFHKKAGHEIEFLNPESDTQ